MSEMSEPHDQYLLEVYRQAGENARMYANSRFSNLSGFLTYVSVLTAGLAFLYSKHEATVQWAVVSVSVMGVALSALFLALEVRHHHWWEFYEFDVVAALEEKMGHSHYPDDYRRGQTRRFINQGRKPRFGLTATRATYGIYVATMCFFVLVGASSALS